jgi:hypothetical protein
MSTLAVDALCVGVPACALCVGGRARACLRGVCSVQIAHIALDPAHFAESMHTLRSVPVQSAGLYLTRGVTLCGARMFSPPGAVRLLWSPFAHTVGTPTVETGVHERTNARTHTRPPRMQRCGVAALERKCVAASWVEHSPEEVWRIEPARRRRPRRLQRQKAELDTCSFSSERKSRLLMPDPRIMPRSGCSCGHGELRSNKSFALNSCKGSLDSCD